MKVFKLILFIQFFSVSPLLSQRNTYVSFELGTSYHRQKVSPNDVFKSISWRDAEWSISLEQDITDKISLSAEYGNKTIDKAPDWMQIQMNFL